MTFCQLLPWRCWWHIRPPLAFSAAPVIPAIMAVNTQLIRWGKPFKNLKNKPLKNIYFHFFYVCVCVCVHLIYLMTFLFLGFLEILG